MGNNNSELKAWLTLLRAPHLGPATLRQMLLAHDGKACDVLAHPLAALVREYILKPATREWLAAPDEDLLAADIAWLEAPEHHFLRFVDDDFPPQLENVDSVPVALFVIGNPDLLLQPQLAIVGSRNASPQGLADSRDFAAQLAAAGLVITSGLADGVDGAAHRAALDAGGRTVAVLGTGVDRLYPRKHEALARDIVAEGALVSEFPLGTPPHARNFPRRNRIISGLSLGTLVIEAGLRSGSLITARLASEQGREVMAVPGSIHLPTKQGCHKLIRDGAALVEHPREVRDLLAGPAQRFGRELGERLQQMSGADDTTPVDAALAPVLNALGEAPASLDELAERTRMPAAGVSSALLELELAGHVASLPGGRFQRLHRPPDKTQA